MLPDEAFAVRVSWGRDDTLVIYRSLGPPAPGLPGPPDHGPVPGRQIHDRGNRRADLECGVSEDQSAPRCDSEARSHDLPAIDQKVALLAERGSAPYLEWLFAVLSSAQRVASPFELARSLHSAGETQKREGREGRGKEPEDSGSSAGPISDVTDHHEFLRESVFVWPCCPIRFR